MKNLLNKKDSQALHGLAILMMVYHHLFVSGNRWFVTKGTSLLDVFNFIELGNSATAQTRFAWFTRICVAIFAFTSGYAIYKQLNGKDIKEMYKYILKRFVSFYFKYFLCFIIFITLLYINNSSYGFDFSLKTYLLNLLGLSSTYNATLWYVSEYYFFLLISPIVYILVNKINIKSIIYIIVVFICILSLGFITGNLFNILVIISKSIQTQFTIYLIIFIEGMFVSKYEIFNYFDKYNNVLVSLIGIIVIYILKALVQRDPSDTLFDIVFIAPFIYFSITIINKSNYLNKILSIFGRYSTYMWYTHAYYYAYLFFGIIIKCNLSLFVYIQVVIYSILSAIILTQIEKTITKKVIKQ